MFKKISIQSIILSIAFLFLIEVLSADSVIYLKNNKEIHCKILKKTPENIYIKTNEIILTIPINLVEEIVEDTQENKMIKELKDFVKQNNIKEALNIINKIDLSKLSEEQKSIIEQQKSLISAYLNKCQEIIQKDLTTIQTKLNNKEENIEQLLESVQKINNSPIYPYLNNELKEKCEFLKKSIGTEIELKKYLDSLYKKRLSITITNSDSEECKKLIKEIQEAKKVYSNSSIITELKELETELKELETERNRQLKLLEAAENRRKIEEARQKDEYERYVTVCSGPYDIATPSPNVWSEPSSVRGKLVTECYPGEKVKFLQKKQDEMGLWWIQIETSNSIIGWVYKEYILEF